MLHAGAKPRHPGQAAAGGPPPPIRLLRDLSRYRADLVGVRTAEKQRVEKLLEDAQIKLSVAASDIFGVSGRDVSGALRPPDAAVRTPVVPEAADGQSVDVSRRLLFSGGEARSQQIYFR